MAATRLSDSQKSELVSGFQAGQSTQVLADRFGCSANTVTRVARTVLGLEVYEQLKRQRSRGGPEAPPAEPLQLTVTITDPEAGDRPRVIARSGAADDLGSGTPDGPMADPGAPEPGANSAADGAEPGTGADGDGLSAIDPVAIDGVAVIDDELDLVAVAEIDAEVDIEDDSEYGDDDEDLIEVDEDGGDDGVDAELSSEDEPDSFLPIAVLGFGSEQGGAPTELRPLNSAQLPASVYMLVDKTVELQARPLREITELGQLPADEQDRQALVVFTNPRQAKRVCGRSQRVIKLPDTRVIERTAPYLLNQGISRVVIEGALYALPGS